MSSLVQTDTPCVCAPFSRSLRAQVRPALMRWLPWLQRFQGVQQGCEVLIPYCCPSCDPKSLADHSKLAGQKQASFLRCYLVQIAGFDSKYHPHPNSQQGTPSSRNSRPGLMGSRVSSRALYRLARPGKPAEAAHLQSSCRQAGA